MRDLLILLVHLIATLARLMGPGGLRSVVRREAGRRKGDACGPAEEWIDRSSVIVR